ncbi:Two-component system sensor histidine kinase, LytS family [Tenacibaculum maritimum NCIMB 2154]|uniref:Two-component system sensor histidine kinase, LytS family n=4 Tax=Tenacibaculum maritimum TaxID=107401 RepID=A0A2H1EC86_9FLAO|nr:Two-component system sensor histidine kinase, LytS family [Tenacibaculum maritimum NCIMB 2154]
MMLSSFKKKVNLSLIAALSTFYTIAFLIRILKISYLKISGLEFIDYTWKELLIDYLYIDYITIIIFTLIVIYSSKQMIEKHLSWTKIITTHLTIAILIGLIVYYLSTLVFVILGQCPISHLNPAIYLNKIVNNIVFIFLINFGMMLIVYIYFHSKKIKKIEFERNTLKNQLTLSKLNLLKSNLQPHFLFNTLNSIATLIYIDKKLAQNTIVDLSDLLRILLNIQDENLISLEEELFMLSKYNNIMKVRFSDHFSFEKDIEKNLMSAKVPSFLLQPIIENSIKYGYSQNHIDLCIKLTVKKVNQQIMITICNNGAPLMKEFSEIVQGIGISTTVERLETLFNNNFSFHMENKKNEVGVITTIKIPHIIS